VVFATGYYDWPNLLGVPGEDLPHVSHYFIEGHRHWHQDVVVIGAGNSAVDAALECWRAGARVTIVHLEEGFDRTVKPWVLPDITNRVKEGSIRTCWNSRVRAITPEAVEIAPVAGGPVRRVPADAVLAMTGYHANTDLLSHLGVAVDPETGVAAHDERTMETPIAGCFLAGVIASGKDANRLFIENARGHGELIVSEVMRRRKG
jgi:thioredoxin reductase (NADPH)